MVGAWVSPMTSIGLALLMLFVLLVLFLRGEGGGGVGGGIRTHGTLAVSSSVFFFAHA